jgi:hypothetical protein
MEVGKMDAQNPFQILMSGQEVARTTAEQTPEVSGGAWEKFAEPRGWALKWDGFSLHRVQKRQGGDDTSASEETR